MYSMQDNTLYGVPGWILDGWKQETANDTLQTPKASYTKQTLQRMAQILAQFKAEQQPEQHQRRSDEYIPLFLGDTV
jgi:hypothetical protein